jgi:flagellar biogenesis protein FliO
MERSNGTRLLEASMGSNEERLIALPEVQGVAAWVLGLFSVWRNRRETPRKQLRLVEMLQLGGKRQLMLVACAGENFLVGAGADSIETIVRLKAETSLSVLTMNSDEPCR